SHNTTFSLYTNQGWVNFKNVFQGFFGSGGAGSGKSVSLVEPVLWQVAQKNMPGLLFDFKNWELTRQVIAFFHYHRSQLKKRQEKWDQSVWSLLPKAMQQLKPRPKAVVDKEVDIKVIDFMNPQSSHRINFLQPRIIDNLIKVDSVIKKFLTALSPADAEKKDIWFNGSVALFKGGLLFFKKHHPEHCTFPHILVFLTMIPTDTIKALFSQDDDVTMVADVYMKAPEKTAGSIAASLSSSLSQLVDPRIFWVLSGDDVDFALNDKDNPALLCLVTDEEFAQSLSPLASIISITCLNAMNKKGRYPSVALFDEFPQIFLDDIDRLPATCRSNKVGIMCVIQDMAQLLKEYGEKRTKALCANLLNKLYFKATDKDTQVSMSDLMGEIDVIKESQSRGTGDGSSNFSVNREKYLNADDVLNFSEGEGLGVKSTGKQERRFHSQFSTLFRLYDGRKHIKGTGYPGMPESEAVFEAIPSSPIVFNHEANEQCVQDNYESIKKEVQHIVRLEEAKIAEQQQTEEEDIAVRTDADMLEAFGTDVLAGGKTDDG
ncbi:MAG: type IV secretory system conjugative DNA transfer family protein, partial [Firmicutes bacterium]|nr:type IV secretory system conjugative DNA transfer family protein [Bacillota bacterium]